MLNPNVPAWFEIPADDLDRAQHFYEAILAQPLVERTALPAGMGYFAQLRDCEGNRVGLWSPA